MTGVIAGYLLFALLVVPTWGNDRSGKQLAQALAQYDNYQIGAFQFYSTAAVYYSGNRLTMLERRDYIHNFREHTFSWFAKYTMPVATVSEFIARTDKPKMVIVPRADWTTFQHEAQGIVLQRVAQNTKYLFYRVQAPRPKG